MDYFTIDQRYHIAQFFKILASDTTWDHLRHYFGDYLIETDMIARSEGQFLRRTNVI